MVLANLTEKVSFEQIRKGAERASHVDISEEEHTGAEEGGGLTVQE